VDATPSLFDSVSVLLDPTLCSGLFENQARLRVRRR
jgi:hypothetical protein